MKILTLPKVSIVLFSLTIIALVLMFFLGFEVRGGLNATGGMFFLGGLASFFAGVKKALS
jgi:hypothetical protein